MYRSRNRPSRAGQDGVKGPSSALTQFLRDQGISAQAIKERWEQQQEKSESDLIEEQVKAEPDQNDDNKLLSGNDSSSTETDDEITATPFDRRMKALANDSDEEEYESSDIPVTRKGQPKDRSTDEKRKKQVLQSRRKKRKRAADLLDRRFDRITSLQDLCISKISENISKLQKNRDEQGDTVFVHIRKVLGGISTDNLKNLAKTLSKNRALNDHTLQLFLKTDLKSLTFHDCSKLSFEGYKALAIFSPHLTELSLQMCGQLNNESLLYISEKLTNLTSIHLDGPFLINESTWDTFFCNMKGRLRGFHVSNTHRFTDNSLGSLLRNCGQGLLSLGLARLDSVSNYSLLPQYINNNEFHTLAIEYPFNEEDVNDEVVINILGQIGQSLRSLVLNGCLELTDSMVINGLTAFLGGNNALETLELEGLTSLTTDSLVYFFSGVSLPCLKRCSLKRCHQIGDMATIELLLNSAKDSLQFLGLNSLNQLTKETFSIMSCPNLSHLDVSFVRCVDDFLVEKIGKQNPKLQLMEVFGDNLITSNAKISRGLTITGRESDTI